MRLTVAIAALLVWPSVSFAQVGTLIHDGPATPEQISLYLPVTGTLTATSANVRFKQSGGASWLTVHPLHRIRPNFTDSSAPFPVLDAFAGVITGLVPGASYDVEVTIAGAGIKTLTVTTRALPGAAGTPNKTIAAGSTKAQIQAVFDGLNPGDVVEFANGTYEIPGLFLNRGGSISQPIYIRGASRDGVILHGASGHVLQIQNGSNVVIEDLTLQGSGVDSGTNSSSEGIRFWDGVNQQKVTVRRLNILGVDKGVVGEHPFQEILVYDSVLAGNNVWTQAFLETNLSWNDDGIRLPGKGNCGFNNTLSGFGDSFAVNSQVENVGVHFYRNTVLWTDDDAFEGDYGTRNMTFYDNHIENSMTLVSFDPLFGGPAFIFRNIAINVGRSPYKFNSTNTGHFIYNNTVIRTNGFGSGNGWGWDQSNNGSQEAWGYRNNILIYRGSGNLLAFEAGGNNEIDFTNNAWFPDTSVWWTSSGGSYSSMAQARAGLHVTTPVFGGSTHRHEFDVISDSDPFITDIMLDTTYLTKVTTFYTPFVADGTAPRSAGVAIPGITDGFTGAAPDIGAMITGIPAPRWGDRTTGPQDTMPPAAPKNLTVS